ncbi:MAG: DUF2147 domain-containing protein [Cytophagaceae bacterium]|nr:DUF2147 domain-containing protein [Cytophagaceae bacterium]
MKKLTLGLLLLLGAVCLASFAFIHSSEEQITGEWLTSNKKAKIKIFKKNEKYYGTISWILEPLKDGKPKVDSNNPDAAKRNQPLMGLILLTGFKYAGDNEWEDGHIYDPEEGKTYSCNMELKDNGKTLHVRGYVGISLIGRTDVWTRVQ